MAECGGDGTDMSHRTFERSTPLGVDMAEARSGAGTKRAGRTDADENGGRAIDDETHAVQRVAQGDEEEMTPESMAEVGVAQENEPDSIGSTIPTKRADGSERRGSRDRRA
jgi:hypothetical protein